jgi:hypothetical protein
VYNEVVNGGWQPFGDVVSLELPVDFDMQPKVGAAAEFVVPVGDDFAL